MLLTELDSQNQIVCISVCVYGMSYIAAPVRVSLPVFLFFLLVCRGHDLSMSLHPGVQSQDALYNMTSNTSSS